MSNFGERHRPKTTITSMPQNERMRLAETIVQSLGGIESVQTMMDDAAREEGEAVIYCGRLMESRNISADRLQAAGFTTQRLIPFSFPYDMQEAVRPFVSLRAVLEALGRNIDRPGVSPEL